MDRSLNRLFEVYVFVFAFFFASMPLSDADFWFHLKTGEYIFSTGLVPKTEIFSFSNYGRPWVAHGWLSGAIFYALSTALGFNFLIFLFALLAALAFWIVFKRCNSHPFIAGAATLLGVWSVLPTIGVRPRVFSLLFASIYLAILSHYSRHGRGKSVWWLVPLMALWVNLHGGFFIGLALVGLTIIGIPLDAFAEGKKFSSVWPRAKMLGFVLIGCLLAGLINPYGIRLYTFPLTVLASPVFQNLTVDWLSPNFHQGDLLPLTLLILLTIAAVSLSRKRIKPSELILFLATLYATLKTQRNMAILALVATPILANHLQSWLESTSLGRVFRRAPPAKSSRKATAISVALLLPLLFFAAKLQRVIYAPPTQAKLKVPVKAVAFLKENRITGNTFTAPNIWGGYLIWALPSNPVYIDGRDVYPEQFVKEFVDITEGLVDWREPFSRYGVRIVLIEPRSLLARQLEESAEWERTYQDEMSVVFRKR